MKVKTSVKAGSSCDGHDGGDSGQNQVVVQNGVINVGANVAILSFNRF